MVGIRFGRTDHIHVIFDLSIIYYECARVILGLETYRPLDEWTAVDSSGPTGPDDRQARRRRLFPVRV